MSNEHAKLTRLPTDDEEEEMIVNKFNHHKQHYFGDFLKKNFLYLSTWSTLRFLNETVKRLKKMQTWAEFQQRSAAVRNSLCEPGRGVYISLSVFFQYLFVRIYRGRKNTKAGKPVANFSLPIRDQRPCRYTANISIHPLSKLDLKTFLKTSFKTGVKVREGVNLKKRLFFFKTLS